MASNIKGIKIEIDGDTQPLQKALKSVNKEATEATQELKQIDKALKFDPGNVTLLTQKQEVLQKQVATTKEKLETLTKAQAQVEQQFKNGDIGADQYRAFQRELEVTQNVLKGYEGKLDSVNQALSSNGQAAETNTNKLNALQSEQSQLSSEMDKVTSSFKLQENALGANASEAEKNALAQKKIGAQSEIVGKQIENLEKQLELTKQEYGENSVEANKLEKALNETKISYNNLQNEMADMANASSGANANLEETNQLLKADALMTFSDKLSQISGKLVEFGQNALEAFRQVDAGMDIIITKTGASGQALEEMTGVAENLATSIPTDFETAGNAVGEVNTQFGLMGDALQLTAEDMIKFAEINGADVTNSTINSKRALEAYGLSVDWLSDVLDSTTYVAQATGASVDDLMKKATDGAPQIKALGLEFSEGVTLIGQFEQAGVDSSAALGSLSKAAVNYAKDGKTLKNGLAETIDKIKSSTSETDALSVASEIFGTKAAPRMVDAIKRGAFSFEALSQTAQNSAGVVGSTYEATLDPIDKFTTAQNSATLAMADIGNAIAEVLAPVMEILADVLRTVASWFNNLPGPIKQFTVMMGMVVAAIGAILPVFLTIKALGMTALTSMLAPMLPIIGAVLGIAAALSVLVIGLKALWQHNEEFRTKVTEIWTAIMAVVNSVVQEISSFVQSVWGEMTSWWQENQELIQSTAKKVWGAISKTIAVAVKLLGPMIKTAFKNIQTVVTAAWKIVQTIIQGTLKNIMGIIKTVMQVINGDWSGAWKSIQEVARNTFNTVRSIIQTALSAILSVFTNSWNTMLSFLSNVFSGIISLAKATWSNLTAFLSSTWSNIASTASNNWNAILTSLQFIWNSLYNAAMTIFNSIKDFIANIWNTISSTASSVWNAIITALQFSWNSLYNTAMTIFNSIKDFIANIWNTISATASSVWNGIVAFLGGIWNGILSTASNIFNAIKDTISNVWSSVSSTASSVWNGIKDTISNAINGAKDIVASTINAIKGLFNFEWSLPRPKIPRFHISGGQAPWGFGGEGSLPSISVEWFAKGGILTKPTAFGMVGNKLAVGGEAGAEAVLPLNERTLGMVADRIMATVTDKIVVNVPQQQPQPIILNIDGKTFAQLMVGHISELQADRLRIIESGGTI